MASHDVSQGCVCNSLVEAKTALITMLNSQKEYLEYWHSDPSPLRRRLFFNLREEITNINAAEIVDDLILIIKKFTIGIRFEIFDLTPGKVFCLIV